MYIFSSFPALNEKGELFKFVDITHRLLLYTADIHTQLASIHSLCRVASTAIFLAHVAHILCKSAEYTDGKISG